MKKLISLVLALCMACMLIPAMAEEDVSGDWYGSLMGMGVQLTLNADGSYTISMSGTVAEEGTWKAEDGKVITTPSSESPATEFAIQDASLYLSADGMEMTMTRNPEDAPSVEIAEVKTDAAVEEFYGEWTCSAVQVEGMTLDADAYTAAAGDTLPSLSIAEGSVKFVGEDMISVMLNLFTLEPAFADGAITATGTLGEGDTASTMTIQLQMLQDGQIKATLDSNGSPMVLFFAPAAAAEEPAA